MALALHLVGAGHGDHPAALVALVEGVEEDAAEHDGHALGQGLFPGTELDRDLLAAFHPEAGGLGVGLLARLLLEQALLERPGGLAAGTEVGESFHGELDVAAGVLVLVAGPPAGVVVDEQAADVELGVVGALDPVLVGAGHRVGHAAAGGPLVLDRGHHRPQVDGAGKILRLDPVTGIEDLGVLGRNHGLVADDRVGVALGVGGHQGFQQGGQDVLDEVGSAHAQMVAMAVARSRAGAMRSAGR